MATRLRSCALLAAGALALHQLRYSLAYGADSGRALREQGHAYLAPVTAVVVALLIVVLAAALHRVASGGEDGRTSRVGRLWARATASLLAVFVAQESAEGLLSTGHPGGAAAVIGHGGWVALPIAAGLGLLIALALRGVRSAAEVVLGVARRLVPARPARAPLALVVPVAPPPRRRTVLARAGAGRAPPLAS